MFGVSKLLDRRHVPRQPDAASLGGGIQPQVTRNQRDTVPLFLSNSQ
jgi:hypothetical protein